MIRPINNHLICSLVEKEKKSSIILTTHEEKKDTFHVLWASENDLGINVDDIILVEQYGFRETQIADQTLYIVNCKSVIAIID